MRQASGGVSDFYLTHLYVCGVSSKVQEFSCAVQVQNLLWPDLVGFFAQGLTTYTTDYKRFQVPPARLDVAFGSYPVFGLGACFERQTRRPCFQGSCFCLGFEVVEFVELGGFCTGHAENHTFCL